MILKISPTPSLQGSLRLPVSKSYSIRAFLIAACGGDSRILHPSDCDDAKVAMSVASALGAEIKIPKPGCFSVKARRRRPSLSKVNVKESGTVLRLLLPLLSIYSDKAVVTGEGTLRGRPNKFLTEALRQTGMNIRGAGEKESIPVVYRGGKISKEAIAIDGSISSQFTSALMIACPQLDHDVMVTIIGQDLVSEDYLVMTRQILSLAGIKIKKKDPRTYQIDGGQIFKGLKNFEVPSDYGLAAFLMAAAAVTKSDVKLTGAFHDNLLQADGRMLGFLQRLGVKFEKTSKAIHIKGPFALKGGTFSLKDCPDLVPVMAALALFAQGPTRLVDIHHARAKESDRISDLRRELLKVGAEISETSDTLVIHPQPLSVYTRDVVLDPHRDHRLAMAFVVLGLKLGASVKDIECTHKSYPGFVADLKTLGAGARKLKSI